MNQSSDSGSAPQRGGNGNEPPFPLPDLDWEPVRPFWAAAAREQLALPRCASCDRLHWYPVPPCRSCSEDAGVEWAPVEGRGTLYAWSEVHHAFTPPYSDDLPFIPALVSLSDDQTVRLVTRIVDSDSAALRCDLPVTVVFRPLRFAGVDGSVVAPLFRPA